MYTYPSDRAYDLIVVHTNEGPEGPRSAENLASYLNRLTASDSPGYHMVVDEDSFVVMCEDNVRVNGAGGVNSRAWHICICGYAGQDTSQWTDQSSMDSIRLCAAQVAKKARKFDIPVVKIHDPRNSRGICAHGDVSAYYASSAGHTDPGPAFPWNEFITLVKGGSVNEIKAEEEMFRLIKGDQRDETYLTNWLEKRPTYTQDEVDAIIKAGVTNGAGVVHWPQAWVDNIIDA